MANSEHHGYFVQTVSHAISPFVSGWLAGSEGVSDYARYAVRSFVRCQQLRRTRTRQQDACRIRTYVGDKTVSGRCSRAIETASGRTETN